ncbi:class I SAM-dependent methyltransferase [Roseibium polysiphoniae]|uniref:Class I SAM-dependent methyltransferase n=1 Tax=Roseibium polysiphoniae TaxID=2571221 RepID=A0ABR9C6I4_9HYPH|nr:class I SAM-dependent methyltransferase [Roseibium polysiphoniae]MBD8875188.1 class I SAM-dependent methyltransferase [Roseibium polysiphoniae]
MTLKGGPSANAREVRNRIRETLEVLNLSSADTLEIYAEETRDVKPLIVHRDRLSGVVLIDTFYVGDETYCDGGYRQQSVARAGARDYEVKADALRRSKSYDQFYTGKRIADFGCGEGAFLQAVSSDAGDVIGIELQESFVKALRQDGISCVRSLQEIEDASLDALFCFHVLEHLPDPLNDLASMRAKLKPGGRLIIEVPHASDLLLSQVRCEAFKVFTLWSQHLLLHTRESLRRMVSYAGFEQVMIEGVQRYPLSNHMTWLANAKPGGHKSTLSILDTPELTAAYEAALRKIDATDTLVAVATAPGI